MDYPIQETYFEVIVKNVNAFSIHFTHTIESYERPYAYFISECIMESVVLNKIIDPLDFGYNLKPVFTSAGHPRPSHLEFYGFGVSNIRDRIDWHKPKPLFNLKMIINVPFFRKGQFLHFNAGWTQKINPVSQIRINYYLGSDVEPIKIYENILIPFAEKVTLPLSWPDQQWELLNK